MMKKNTYLNIGGVPEHFNIPFRKSIFEGVFSAKNIELNWRDYAGGTGALVQAFKEKKLDLGVLLTEGAIKAIGDDADFKIIQIYVNSPLYWGIYAGDNSSFKTLDDVKKPQFNISRYGSGSNLMAYLLAEREGWDAKDLEFFVIQNFNGALRAFNAEPDRLFLWERFMTKPYVDSGTLKKIGEIPTPWPSFCIVATNDLIDNQRDMLLEFLEIISGYTYKFKQNSQESISYLSQYFHFSIDDMKEWFASTDWNYVIDPPQYKIESAVSFLGLNGLIEPHQRVDDYCVSTHFF